MQTCSILLEVLMPAIERHADYGQFIILAASVLLLFILITVKVLFPKYLKHLFFITFKQDLTRGAYFETSSSIKQADVFMLFASTISISAAMYAVFRYFPYNTIILSDAKTFLEFAFIILGVITILLLKHLIYNYFAWLFDMQIHKKAYFIGFYNLLRLTGIILFPIFILIPFVGGMFLNVLIALVLITGGLVFFYNMFIFFRQSLKIKFLNHYCILYFCIFEILPIIVLIKLLSNF
ncbi:MAG: DUF4271 domain-containing protein [Bacteroidales bacterium]|nr:DUF4271 domain-containing protein [Bacteroidales bacterium]